MRVRFEADERTKGREHQRQRDHQCNERGGHPELDDHHAIERSVHQHQSHADGDLKQRQAQQSADWQFDGGRIGKGQEFRTQPDPALYHDVACRALHRLTSSMA